MGNHLSSTLVVSFLIDIGVVMPATDAVARLPGDVDQFIWCATLHIPCESLTLRVTQDLAKDHATRILVVKMGSDTEAAVTERIERQHGDIEIDEVGLIAVDGIEGAVVEVRNEFLRWRTGTVLPSPLIMYLAIAPRVIAHRMVLTVKKLWVETFPPFALTIGLRQVAIIEDTGLGTFKIETLRWFIPRPRMVCMEGDAQRKTNFLGSFGPTIENILVRTDAHGIPLLIL